MRRILMPTLSIALLTALTTAGVWLVHQTPAQAHCQVPCGIYDDPARIAQLREDATTIAKAVDQIKHLAGQHDPLAFNQATRWVMTKENHATHIIDVVSEYFLTQKVKPAPEGSDGHDAYLHSLADHHAVMVAAMKCKQTVDPAEVANLNKAIDALAKHYAASK